MRVVFLRHGESEYNAKDLVNTDSKVRVDLTKLGRKQAKDAGEKLAGKKFDVIFVSEFLRSQETARIVDKKLRVGKMIVDKRLNELGAGFEGEKGEVYRKAIVDSGERKYLFKAKPDYESYEDVKNRLFSFLNDLRGRRYNSVLVVTHDVVLQMASVLLGGRGEDEAVAKGFKNCKILEYEI